jgi:lipooligosaccharide transport system ATP-binding protein
MQVAENRVEDPLNRTQQPHLRVHRLRKAYDGADVVAGIDLEIEPGVCFGLLGPNGAGKTTTLRLCLGLTDPDDGEISMLGFPVPEKARDARLRVGVVPQVDNLDPDFTVRENLLVYGSYFGLRKRVFHHCSNLPDSRRAKSRAYRRYRAA